MEYAYHGDDVRNRGQRDALVRPIPVRRLEQSKRLFL